MRSRIGLLLLVLVLAFAACDNDTPGETPGETPEPTPASTDRKSTRLNSSH